jgi:hypothetical protein
MYPQGVSQYRIANKASLPVLTERFIGSVRENGGDPGRQIAEEAHALLDAYQTLRNGQLQVIGSAKGLSACRIVATRHLENVSFGINTAFLSFTTLTPSINHAKYVRW